ncbi:hypothetical protein CPB86DRAFT_83534 [Serendipita vermifera]|nr:hypothetical protein CPB86DRAFT_83534 [Serendipita vermifera]
MGYWDELCAICGLSPGGGPYEIFANGCLEDCLDAIIESLAKQNLALDINESELRSELRSVLRLFKLEALEVPTAYEEATKSGSISSGSYFPFHSDQWDGWKAIAIGVFDDSFSDPEGLTKLSQGYAVTTRLVTHPTGNGGLFEGIEGQIGLLTTNASAYEGNLFCLRTPYLYLQSWVDRDSLPLRRTAFPFEPEMSFEGEFYEIIQFWEMGYRDDFGTLPGICYGGIERALDQFQDHFFSGFEGASELGRALQSGMRGNDLIPALLGDFKVWQTCPPDRWVKIDSFISSSHTQVLFSKAPTAVGHWSRLPTEVVFQIFLNMPIDGILAFVSTCSSLRHRYGNPIFLSRLLRSRMRRPFDDFHWFLPVSTVQGEVDCHEPDGLADGEDTQS